MGALGHWIPRGTATPARTRGARGEVAAKGGERGKKWGEDARQLGVPGPRPSRLPRDLGPCFLTLRQGTAKVESPSQVGASGEIVAGVRVSKLTNLRTLCSFDTTAESFLCTEASVTSRVHSFMVFFSSIYREYLNQGCNAEHHGRLSALGSSQSSGGIDI